MQYRSWHWPPRLHKRLCLVVGNRDPSYAPVKGNEHRHYVNRAAYRPRAGGLRRMASILLLLLLAVAQRSSQHQLCPPSVWSSIMPSEKGSTGRWCWSSWKTSIPKEPATFLALINVWLWYTILCRTPQNRQSSAHHVVTVVVRITCHVMTKAQLFRQ